MKTVIILVKFVKKLQNRLKATLELFLAKRRGTKTLVKHKWIKNVVYNT